LVASTYASTVIGRSWRRKVVVHNVMAESVLRSVTPVGAIAVLTSVLLFVDMEIGLDVPEQFDRGSRTLQIYFGIIRIAINLEALVLVLVLLLLLIFLLVFALTLLSFDTDRGVALR